MMASVPDDPLAANDDPDISEQVAGGFEFNVADPGELPPGRLAAIAARPVPQDGWQFWAIRVPELSDRDIANLEHYAKTLVQRFVTVKNPAEDSWAWSNGQWWLSIGEAPDDAPDLSFLEG